MGRGMADTTIDHTANANAPRRYEERKSRSERRRCGGGAASNLSRSDTTSPKRDSSMDFDHLGPGHLSLDGFPSTDIGAEARASGSVSTVQKLHEHRS